MKNRRLLKVGITCYPSVGGSGVVATALGVELAKRGHEVHFISYERPFRLGDEAERIFFHPVVINDYELFRYPDYTLPLSVKMAEVSRDFRLDILHVHYAVPHATAAIIARCMLKNGHQPAVVTTLHGTDTTLLGRDPGYGPAIYHALTESDAVTTVSSFLERETRQVLGFNQPMHVIHNFFEPLTPAPNREQARKALGFGDELVILHSSNLRPVKRIDLLLETFARVRKRHDARLLVLAGGSFEPFGDQVRALGLESSIVVRENVAKIEDYISAADLNLVTSESESFCLSILEAMSFGCPSVATRVGGIPEVIESEVSGLLAPSGDVEALTDAVCRLIEDEGLRKRLGESGKRRAREQFSADAIVSQYENLYRQTAPVDHDCNFLDPVGAD